MARVGEVRAALILTEGALRVLFNERGDAGGEKGFVLGKVERPDS